MSKRIYDAYIKRQIYLERLKKGEGRAAVAQMIAADRKARKIINDLPLNPTKSQINTAVNKVESIYKSAYTNLRTELIRRSIKLAGIETQWLERTLKDELSDIVEIDVEQALSDITRTPYQGKTLPQWMNNLTRDKIARVRRIAKQSYSSKSDRLTDFTKEVNVSNNHTNTLAKTYLNHYVQNVRHNFYTVNDIISTLVWVSVLDGRTSNICILRSNKQYDAQTKAPLGHSLPWDGGPGNIHFNCRSIAIPSSPGMDTSKYPKSYDEWLRTQPKKTVIEILGENKAELFLAGMTIAAFVVLQEEETTVDEANPQ